jgi:prophage maintenance system killer protein
MVSFLRLNGRRIEATVVEAEQAIVQVASGSLDRTGLQAWIEAHEVPRS